MQPQILVLSNPPHQEVDADAVAETVGIPVEDVRLKINFSAPEVLSASNLHRAQEIAGSLRDAGMSVVVLDGDSLTRVPWAVAVTSFETRDDGLVAQTADGDLEIGNAASLFGVYCKPPPEFPLSGPAGAAPPSEEAPATYSEALEWQPHLDLFVENGGTQRLVFGPGLTDFQGLADMRQASGGENVAATVGLLRRRFSNLTIDDRLVDVRPRQRFVMGDESFDLDLRKLYSFGTLLLRQVLDSISPELRDLTQYELGARLAYALHRREANGTD